MPWKAWEEIIDGSTPDETLQRILIAAERTSDRNIVQAAGRARAEIARREQQQRMDELLVQINAQQEMVDKQIEATRTLRDQQAKDTREQANRQMRISRFSAIAAWGAAIAAFLNLVLGGIELRVW